MQQKMNEKMEQANINFGELAEQLGISKQTLTKKVQGKMDWTFPEMTKLTTLLQIEDPQSFFFS